MTFVFFKVNNSVMITQMINSVRQYYIFVLLSSNQLIIKIIHRIYSSSLKMN